MRALHERDALSLSRSLLVNVEQIDAKVKSLRRLRYYLRHPAKHMLDDWHKNCFQSVRQNSN